MNVVRQAARAHGDLKRCCNSLQQVACKVCQKPDSTPRYTHFVSAGEAPEGCCCSLCLVSQDQAQGPVGAAVLQPVQGDARSADHRCAAPLRPEAQGKHTGSMAGPGTLPCAHPQGASCDDIKGEHLPQQHHCLTDRHQAPSSVCMQPRVLTDT